MRRQSKIGLICIYMLLLFFGGESTLMFDQLTMLQLDSKKFGQIVVNHEIIIP